MALTESAMPYVLVVDDDPDMREVMSRFLAGAGYEVSAAGGVLEGLDAMDRRSPDVVVADFVMPDGTGSEILEGARKLPTGPPVIVVSCTVCMDTASDLLSAGAAGVLAKPFSRCELLGVVHAVSLRSWAGSGLSPSGAGPVTWFQPPGLARRTAPASHRWTYRKL